MSDHKASAQDWLRMADEHSDWVIEAPKKAVGRYLAAAQAEATLYLAEQQRIANLIAWDARDRGPVDFTDWPADVVASYIKDDQAVLRQIHEGLGLA